MEDPGQTTKDVLRRQIMEESSLADDLSGDWGKAAERLRKLPVYRNARTILAARSPILRQVQLNALADGKTLILPTPGIQKGFLKLDPKVIPPQKRNLAIRLTEKNPLAPKIPYKKARGFSIELMVTDSLAAGRDGSRLGDGQGHLDLQWSILLGLGWIPPLPVVATLVGEERVLPSIPMKETDVGVNLIVTPKEVVETDLTHQPLSGILWDLLEFRQIRRNDALFLLHRQMEEAKGAPGGLHREEEKA